MCSELRDGRGTMRAGHPWRGLGRALLAALRVAAATGLRSPHCRRLAPLAPTSAVRA